MTNFRPKLTSDIPLNEFKSNYWLLEELKEFCRTNGLNTAGGKLEISSRIELLISKGINANTNSAKKRTTSHFDWSSEKLSYNTLITDNYRNSENVRAFFKEAIGRHFKFNTEFMNWMKRNAGKTLNDAAEAWKEIKERQKDPNYQSDISPQFEYNKYIRDLLKDNPGLTIKEAIICWKEKKKLPVPKKYHKDDLRFIL